MYYNNRKYIVKNVFFIVAILALAIFATHKIYYHFTGVTDTEYSSESLDIVFHEKDGSKVALTKVVPVTDSLGLSTDAYSFTINNNLTDEVEYRIRLVDDNKSIDEDACGDIQIPKDLLRVSLKVANERNEIYTLSDLDEGILLISTLKPLEEKDYSIRIWVNDSSTINIGKDLHYHGIIKVEEIESDEK